MKIDDYSGPFCVAKDKVKRKTDKKELTCFNCRAVIKNASHERKFDGHSVCIKCRLIALW
jgi:hypothetical protein